MAKYTREHWDEYTRLVGTGLSGSKALQQMGIPKGSYGTMKERFNGVDPVVSDEPSGPPEESHSIGELAQQLNRFTEELLNLTAQLSELTSHAYGLVLLEKTLGQLEIKQMEATGLRRSLEEAERRLISCASVVHSND